MKTAIFVTTLFLAGNAMAAQDYCGVQVQDSNVQQATATEGLTVGFVRALMEIDHANIKECFSKQGAVVVGIFPNGETRAVIF